MSIMDYGHLGDDPYGLKAFALIHIHTTKALSASVTLMKEQNLGVF